VHLARNRKHTWFSLTVADRDKKDPEIAYGQAVLVPNEI